MVEASWVFRSSWSLPRSLLAAEVSPLARSFSKVTVSLVSVPCVSPEVSLVILDAAFTVLALVKVV